MSKRWTEEELKKLRPGQLPEGFQLSATADEQKKGNSPQKATQALGRLKKGQMNLTEAKYAQHLDLQKAAGEIIWWEFEPLNLRIGDNCFLDIDFMIMKKGGEIESHDVKGYWTDDALVKMRAAAAKFPWPIIAVQLKKGEWIYRHF